MSLERLTPVLGSSANRSETGSKFRVEDIDPEARSAADLTIDYGLRRCHNRIGTSSTIIDLRRWFRIELPSRPKQGDAACGAALPNAHSAAMRPSAEACAKPPGEPGGGSAKTR